jgi:hypothetical protein
VVIRPISPQTRSKAVGFAKILDGADQGNPGEGGESYQVLMVATSRTSQLVSRSRKSFTLIDLKLLVCPAKPENLG